MMWGVDQREDSGADRWEVILDIIYPHTVGVEQEHFRKVSCEKNHLLTRQAVNQKEQEKEGFPYN